MMLHCISDGGNEGQDLGGKRELRSIMNYSCAAFFDTTLMVECGGRQRMGSHSLSTQPGARSPIT